jgi:hypothetical protein
MIEQANFGGKVKILASAALAILVVSSPLMAQRQGNAGNPGQRGPGQNQNTVALIIEKSEDLDLTTQQLERLEIVRLNLDEANEPHTTELRNLRGSGGRPDPSARERMRPLLEAMQANQGSAMEAVMAILTDEQKGPAREIVENARPRRRNGQGRGGRPGGGGQNQP